MGRLISIIGICLLGASILSAQDIEQVAKEQAWDWSGAVGANVNAYGVQGIEQRSNPIFWNLNGQFTGKIYGFQLPFSFSLGQHDFTFSRPFLQAGLSPSYKWAKLHLGTRNLFFSPYTLAGHSFDGAGVELTPGKFRFSAMYGRLRRAREYTGELDGRFYPALYRRMAYAIKIGVGDTKNYFDVSYLQGWDVEHSITVLPQDTTLTPAKNTVLGLSGGFTIAKRLQFFAEGAVSLFTRNTNSLPADALVDVPWAETLEPTLSTRLNYAFKTGLRMDFGAFRLKTAFERIMPQFETMGAYFFANDRQNITIGPSIRLWQNRISLTGNVGLQRNNLLGTRSETTTRLIGNANLSFFTRKGFGLSANYTNYNIEQTEAQIALSDSLRQALVTTNISVVPTYTWGDTSSVHSIVLSGNYQQLNDQNPFTRDFTNMTTQFATASYSLQLIYTGTSITGGANYQLIALPALETTRYGGTLSLGQTFDEGTWQLQMGATYNWSLIAETPDGRVLSGNASLAYRPHPKHRFSLYSTYLRNTSLQFVDFTEWYGGLSYQWVIR